MINGVNSTIPYSGNPLKYSFMPLEPLAAPCLLLYAPMAQLPKFNNEVPCNFRRVDLSPNLIRNVTKAKETKLKLIAKTGKGKRHAAKTKSAAINEQNLAVKAKIQSLLESIQATVFNAKKGSEEKMTAMGKLLVAALREIPEQEKLAKKLVTWTHKNYSALKASEVRAIIEKRIDYASPNLMPRRAKVFREPATQVLSVLRLEDSSAPLINDAVLDAKKIPESQTATEIYQPMPEHKQVEIDAIVRQTILERFHELDPDVDFAQS